MKRGLKCGSFFQDIKKIKPKYANQFKFLYFSFILSLKNWCIIIFNCGSMIAMEKSS